MKKQILLIIAIFMLVGCSSKLNLDQGIVKSSNPVFIEISPKNKKTYIEFTNSSRVDSNLTSSISEYLLNNGYDIVDKESLASIVLKGNLNYFRCMEVVEYDWLGYQHYRGFGWHWHDDYYDKRYIYDAEISLLIYIKGDNKDARHETNLTFQSDKNLYSNSTITEIFNYQIYKRIYHYLNSNKRSSLNDERL
ncbi:MAG: hypothetical protein GXZ15_03810 [Campylobacter sp.]|nr:hypothetical protein [Campylobacter sp.]